MRRHHRTGWLEAAPDQTPLRIGQDGRRDFRPVKAMEPHHIRRTLPPALADEDIEEFPAIATHHRLDFAMNAAVRSARNPRAIVALRTLEEVSPAHALEIQPAGRKLKSAVTARSQRFLADCGFENSKLRSKIATFCIIRLNYLILLSFQRCMPQINHVESFDARAKMSTSGTSKVPDMALGLPSMPN